MEEGSRNRHSGGVGLSIAHGIVRRHGGRLQLRNALGSGLLATVALSSTLT